MLEGMRDKKGKRTIPERGKDKWEVKRWIAQGEKEKERGCATATKTDFKKKGGEEGGRTANVSAAPLPFESLRHCCLGRVWHIRPNPAWRIIFK